MSSCNLNCSEGPRPWSPDNDITGPGVITNYIASAGIAIFTILVYYFSVYEPDRDPFGKEKTHPEDRPFRANAIDQMVTRKTRDWSRGSISERFKIKLENYFVKYIVALGDLQLITGFSILIGGSVQLDCGLTVYEWQVIVDLAWFSCLTHLSCLMVLRSYLYVHTFARIWRLAAMGILATLLVFGLLPTANYVDLLYSRSPDYAKCYLAIRPSSDLALWSMNLSVLIIIIGFFSRVVKLHKALSVTLWGGLRTRMSVQARSMLRVVYNWCSTSGPVQGLRFSLVYRPLFAVFLVARFGLDVWSSMFAEVLWLFIAFIWGILRLMAALNDTPKEQDLWTMPTSHQRGDWTFGQVVSLVLLAAPFINLLEYLDQNPVTYPSTSPPRDAIELIGPMSCTTDPSPPPSIETTLDPEDPDGNWSNQSSTLGMAIIYGLISMINVTMELYLFFLNSSLIEVFISLEWGIKVVLVFTGVYGIVLFSLLIQSEVSEKKQWTRGCLQFLNLAFYVLSFNFTDPSPLDRSYLVVNYMQLFALSFYGLLAVLFWWAPGNGKVIRSHR
ncbi:hypothetical protein N7522_002708 [Penicillium canescens]|nr:hypothetical protein N7522_002708 [Penicillium canescens]